MELASSEWGFDKRDPRGAGGRLQAATSSLPHECTLRYERARTGLRRALLPRGLPARQPDPGLERPRLRRPLAATRSSKLHATNNFPEFTGLICPAPCESACVLDINEPARDDRQLDLLDRDGVVVDVEHAGRLARRRADQPGELGEVVGGVELRERVAPVVAGRRGRSSPGSGCRAGSPRGRTARRSPCSARPGRAASRSSGSAKYCR